MGPDAMDYRGLRPSWMLHQRRTTSQITDCVSVPALIHVQYDALLVLDGDYLQVLDGATKIIDSLKSRQPDATSHNIDRWRAGGEAGNRHPVSGSRVGVAFFQIDECRPQPIEMVYALFSSSTFAIDNARTCSHASTGRSVGQ